MWWSESTACYLCCTGCPLRQAALVEDAPFPLPSGRAELPLGQATPDLQWEDLEELLSTRCSQWKWALNLSSGDRSDFWSSAASDAPVWGTPGGWHSLLTHSCNHKTLPCFLHFVKQWLFWIFRCAPSADKVWISLYAGRVGWRLWVITSRTVNCSVPSVIWATWATAEMTICSGRDFPLGISPWAFPHTVYASAWVTDIPGAAQDVFLLQLAHSMGRVRGGVGRRQSSGGSGIVPGHRGESYVSSQLPLTTGRSGQRHSCPENLLKGSQYPFHRALVYCGWNFMKLGWTSIFCQRGVLSEASVFVSLTLYMPSVGHETYVLSQIMIVLWVIEANLQEAVCSGRMSELSLLSPNLWHFRKLCNSVKICCGA